MLDVMLVLLKCLSILSAAVFGILGLLHDFKDRDGRITKWGGWSLFGVILSAMVAGAIEAFAFVKASEDNTAQAKHREDLLHRIDTTTTKSEQVLHEVSRAVYPIEDLKISFVAELPLKSTEMKPLRDRLRNEAAAFLKLPPDQQAKGNDAFRVRNVWQRKPGVNEPYSLEVRPGNSSLLAPEEGAEENVLRLVSCGPSIKVEFYSPPISPEQYPAEPGLVRRSEGAALSVWAGRYVGEIDLGTSGEFLLEYYPHFESLWYDASNVPVSENCLISTGQIVGIPDLLGSQMFVRYYTGTDLPKCHPLLKGSFNSLLNDVKIRGLGLAFKGGRQFWFEEPGFTRHSNKRGISFYVYQVPRELPTLFKASHPHEAFLYPLESERGGGR
jgi:hypothetical protein